VVGLIVLVIITSIVAGASHFVYASSFSPLIVGGAFAAIATAIAWLRKPVWALYIAIFVVLLPKGLIPDHIQSILNRSTLLIALGAWLFAVITRRRRIVWTSTALFMLSFLVWSTVTLAWAPHPDLGLERLTQFAFRLILYLLLVTNEINTEETLDELMQTLAFSGWILVLSGVGTLLFQGYDPGTRFQVLGMNENQFGISTMVTMPGVLWLAIRAPERRKALNASLSFVFILLAFIFVVLSRSRGSLISWLTTMLVFWLWKPTRAWGRLGLFILVVTAVSAPFLLSATLERFTVQRGGTLLGGRGVIWQAAWLLIRDHLWVGVGIGNAPYAVVSYLRTLTSLLGLELGAIHEGLLERAIHNPILEIWAEVGIPGILLYFSILGSALWSFRREAHQWSETSKPSLESYFAIVSSVFAGYMLSWIKGGGMTAHSTYFMMLALLLIPSHIDTARWECVEGSNVQDAGRGKL
jgi:O-antigen ligase